MEWFADGALKGAKMRATETTRDSDMKYTVILEREADGGYVASVPVLPGCVSQGDTKQEVMTNILEAMELYVEDCIAAGDPVPAEDSMEFLELALRS